MLADSADVLCKAGFSVYDPWNDVTTEVTDGQIPEFRRDVVVTFATKDFVGGDVSQP